jgi:uncharacterized protein YjiS (DUF1127 family)
MRVPTSLTVPANVAAPGSAEIVAAATATHRRLARRMAAAFAGWRQRRAAWHNCQVLSDLDDRTLADIGVERALIPSLNRLHDDPRCTLSIDAETRRLLRQHALGW